MKSRLLILALLSMSCTKSLNTKCYECTTYTCLTHYHERSYTTTMQCGLTDADVQRMEADTTLGMNFSFYGYLVDTTFVKCK